LPKGACPIDFAYAVHTAVGDKCSGARVNGVIVPLRYQLRNGDTIEIITSPNQKPNKDWLKFVVTSRAKAKIRHLLRTEQRERARVLGKELLEREMRKWGMSWNKVAKNGEVERAVSTLRTGTIDDLVASVGYGRLTAGQVSDVLVPEDRKKLGPDPNPQASTNPIANLFRKVTRRTASTGIKVAGEGDVLVRYGKCCSPLPGDAIVGFITRGRGVTVHTRECQKALDLDPERRVEVEWDGKAKAQRPVTIQVLCADKPGILAVISQSLSEGGVNISQAQCRSTDDNRAVNTFQFNVSDLDQLKNVMRNLQRISGVFSVERLTTTP
jgi:GTP pyrophosphokinase